MSLLLALCLTSTTSALLTGSLLRSARRTVAGIGLLVFWLSALIVPFQALALLEILGFLSPMRPSLLLALYGVALACALVLYARTSLRHRDKPEQPEALPCSRPSVHVGVGLVVVLGVYGVLALRMACGAPQDWDALTYHYPVALRWLQDGTLRIAATTNWRASLPGNVEILDVLVLSTGREHFLQAVQWPGVLVLSLATWHLGRKVGGSAAAAWAVVTTVLIVPVVARQSASGYVDLFGTALLAGSLALISEYHDILAKRGGASPSLLLAAGLACGLAVGTKPVFYLYALALTSNLVLLLLRHRRPWQSACASLGVFLAGAALPSTFWFARAALCTGNPLYPFSLQVGSLVLPGVRTSEITNPHFYLAHVRHWAEWFVYPWTEWKRDPGYLLVNYAADSGLGGAFATFAAPGVIFAAVLAARRRPDLRVWLVNLAFLGFSWWFLLNKVLRFGLPLFVLAIIVSAPFFDVLERGATRLYRWVYLLAITVTAAVIVFAPLHSIAQRWTHPRWSRAHYLEYPRIIDTLPQGSKLLSLCNEQLNFALAGSSLTNRVIPSWERPSVLTAAFLKSHQVDFVVETSTRDGDDDATGTRPPIDGLDLYFRGSLPAGETVVEWQIWSAGRLRSK